MWLPGARSRSLLTNSGAEGVWSAGCPVGTGTGCRVSDTHSDRVGDTSQDPCCWRWTMPGERPGEGQQRPLSHPLIHSSRGSQSVWFIIFSERRKELTNSDLSTIPDTEINQEGAKFSKLLQ